MTAGLHGPIRHRHFAPLRPVRTAASANAVIGAASSTGERLLPARSLPSLRSHQTTDHRERLEGSPRPTAGLVPADREVEMGSPTSTAVLGIPVQHAEYSTDAATNEHLRSVLDAILTSMSDNRLNRPAPFLCVFCLRSDVPFDSVEHPIAESLGNDELIIPRGWVCDSCNSYFGGSTIESKVLAFPPFSVERVAYSVPTKKGRNPHYQGSGFGLRSTGFTDRVSIVYEGDQRAVKALLRTRVLVPSIPHDYDNLMARFLLKIGLELLLLEGVDVAHRQFDGARRCARYGHQAGRWDVGYGIYPSRSDFIVGQRWDAYGPMDTRQLYQYSMGVMASGDIMLCFIYGQHVLACNLSRPPATEYILGFNVHNPFTLRSRWSYAPGP